MTICYSKLALAAVAALTVSACADGSTGLLSTSAITPAAPSAQSAKVDPACVALTARIAALRQDGVVDRVEKVSTGKTKSVTVKRESLAKLAELDRANAEFQQKCSVPLPASAAAPAPATVPPQAAATATGAATAKVASTAAATTTSPVKKAAQ